MLSIKQWNKLTYGKRWEIVGAFFHYMSKEFRRDMIKPFHHNFDWEGEPNNYQEGAWYKLMLSSLYKQKDGKIKVVIKV